MLSDTTMIQDGPNELYKMNIRATAPIPKSKRWEAADARKRSTDICHVSGTNLNKSMTTNAIVRPDAPLLMGIFMGCADDTEDRAFFMSDTTTQELHDLSPQRTHTAEGCKKIFTTAILFVFIEYYMYV